MNQLPWMFTVTVTILLLMNIVVDGSMRSKQPGSRIRTLDVRLPNDYYERRLRRFHVDLSCEGPEGTVKEEEKTKQKTQTSTNQQRHSTVLTTVQAGDRDCDTNKAAMSRRVVPVNRRGTIVVVAKMIMMMMMMMCLVCIAVCCCSAFQQQQLTVNNKFLTTVMRKQQSISYYYDSSSQSTTTIRTVPLRLSHHHHYDHLIVDEDDNDPADDDTGTPFALGPFDHMIFDRRQMLTRSAAAAAAAAAAATATVSLPTPAVADADATISEDDKLVGTDPDTGKPIYKTPSGLEYIDLSSSLSKKVIPVSPRYGQLVGFSYVGYLRLPKDDTKQKQKFATQSTTYITKHGNGKLIAGLDEGLHTMKVGQTRRLIIPPKLGFVQSGLGPLPEQPWQRWKLNSLLDQMIAQQGGRLIYDVTLERVFDDEADQGYYEGLCFCVCVCVCVCVFVCVSVCVCFFLS